MTASLADAGPSVAMILVLRMPIIVPVPGFKGCHERFDRFRCNVDPWIDSKPGSKARCRMPTGGSCPLCARCSKALSRSTALLRDADWNLEATDQPEPSSEHVR